MSARANMVLAGAVGVVVVAAAVSAVVAAQRDPVSLDPGTPAATVQAYLAGIAADDLTAAARQLSDESPCTVDDLLNVYIPDTMRVVLVDEEITDQTAVVRVTITEGSGDGPFDSSGYSHTERLLLGDEGGEWRLVGSPWPLYDCSAGVSKG
ncbi:MAG: hypothetical protein HGA44_03820 [Cellulomonadaceae bacterium]|nr:hypothetical protein [Cellulomonadaceae bacterium]